MKFFHIKGNVANFLGDYRSGVPLRKTAVSFPCDETAACLSTSLLLTLSKDHTRLVSEAFFLSGTPSLFCAGEQFVLFVQFVVASCLGESGFGNKAKFFVVSLCSLCDNNLEGWWLDFELKEININP